MDFNWSEDQKELRSAGIEIAQQALNEGFYDRERDGDFHVEGWKRLAEFGVHGLPIPPEYGGMGADALTAVGVLESLGYACKDNGLLFSVNAHMWTSEVPILDFGTEEQKRKFLPRLCSGEWIGGNAMSEPGSGSDAFSMSTTAVLRGDRYVLTGSKTFVTNGPVADLVVVFARTPETGGKDPISAFLVETDTPGLQRGAKIEKMGLTTSPMCELFFDDCEVAEENRLGREGAGKNIFTHSLTWERSCILASAVGTMQRILETCLSYSKTRKQFGEQIGKFQMVASKIVDMKLRVETARAMLYKAGWLRAQGKSIFLEAALAKLHISEAWVATAQDAIQVHGGYGYMKEYEMERELRDAVGSKLYSGTSEIQRVIAASLLGL